MGKLGAYEENSIVVGDCLEVMAGMPDGCVDLVVTDPPYGVGDCLGNDDILLKAIDWLKEMFRVSKSHSHAYIFIPTKLVDFWIATAKRAGFTYNNSVATSVYALAHHRLENNFIFDLQLIFYGSKGKAKPFREVDWIPTSESWLRDARNKNPKPYTYHYSSFIRPEWGRANVKANANRPLLHPCEKSPELIEKLIALSSNEGDLIFDPFTGSGTTAVAADRLGRRWLGCDINPDYVNMALERLAKDRLERSQLEMPI